MSDPLTMPGRTIGGYRLEHKVGAGGMGAVYAAIDPTIGRRVAVKVLRTELAADDNHALRFEREARSVSLVRHPAIVDVFSFGKLEDGRPYFVMPLYEGRTLTEELARTGRLAPAEAWRIAREIGEGLVAAHDAGVLHRDLKPDNVFIADVAGRRSQPVLLDFGLAQWVEGTGEDMSPEDRVKLTATGVPIGTPLYMAPEQWWSAPATSATDQYAFGIVLFEMLAGRPPFRGRRFPELLEQHLHEAPPTLASVDVEVPSAVEALVAKLLVKEPSGRFSSFRDVIAHGDEAFGVTRDEDAAHVFVRPPTSSRDDVIDAPPSERRAPRSSTDRTPIARLGRYGASFLVTLAVLVGVGYAGQDRWNVVAWIRNAGFGAPLSLVAALGVLVLLPRLVARRAACPALVTVSQLLAIVPSAMALMSTVTGWQRVVEGVDSMPDRNQAFAVLHQGRYEIGSCDFIGFGLTASLSLGLVALLSRPGALSKRGAQPPEPSGLRDLARTPWTAIGLATIASASVMLALGVSSAVFTLTVAGVSILWLAGSVARPSPLAREMGLAAACATLSARAVSQVRADVHAASAWVEPTTRADRVAAMMDAARDRTVTGYVTTAALLLVVGCAAHAVLRARDSALHDSARSARRGLFAVVQLSAVSALFAASLWIDRAFEERRASIVGSLNEQLTLFAHLSPPTAKGAQLPPPADSPALQITKDAVALNGTGIGKLSALDAESGRQAISTPIVAALASPRSPGARTVDLTVLVDRDVSWSRVEELLAIAYEAGARSVDFLLTRGAEPVIPRGAPPEVANLLPVDFGAVEVVLTTEGPETEGVTFDDVAQALLASRDGEPHRLRVHARARERPPQRAPTD